MVLVVPFDGSDLSRVALVRAAQFDEVLHEGVVAVSVIPQKNLAYAREKGWISPEDDFDEDRIVTHLRGAVDEIAPDADFHHLGVERYASRGTVANVLRNFARSHDASIVFLGSENAGHIVAGLTVGRSIAADTAYDTMLINSVRPSNAERLEAALSTTDALD